MSKSIKISDAVYHRLEDFQDKKETKDQAIERLVEIAERVKELGAAAGSREGFKAMLLGTVTEG